MSRQPYSSALERWFEAQEKSHIERATESWLMRHSPEAAGRLNAGPQIWLIMGSFIFSFMPAVVVGEVLKTWFSIESGAWIAIMMSLWVIFGIALGTTLAWRSAMRTARRIEQARTAPLEGVR